LHQVAGTFGDTRRYRAAAALTDDDHVGQIRSVDVGDQTVDGAP
jgi:hypothetical protein